MDDYIEECWKVRGGRGPVLATAIHAGHTFREELKSLCLIDENDRLREEDPYTDQWVWVGDMQIVATHSRFEVDLNRSREKAVYRRPEDAWGMNLWREDLSEEIVERSLALYDAFYSFVGDQLRRVEAEYGRFVVLDLHSYNHRRGGAEAAPDDPAKNPQVNLGTGSMPREKWSGVVERVMHELRSYPFPGGELDVRENVKFQGGYFAQWVHEHFDSGCVLAIEFQKFFMDEWTGQADKSMLEQIGSALEVCVSGIRQELERM